ncbi:MAG: OsmC family protein [Chloroflexi bacterium]|nr:OsmC family protein [Chloroflexota bacterium]
MARTVTVRSGTRYQTSVTNGKHTLVSDEPEGTGDDFGPTPTELLLGALGACTSITLLMYAERKSWPLQSVRVDLDLAGRDPGQISRRIIFEGPLNEEQRDRLGQIAARCPTHKLIAGPTVITDEVSVTR